jgi:predicted Zn-dependent protease
MTQMTGNSDPRVVEAIKYAIALNSEGQTDLAVQHLLPLMAEFPAAASIPGYVALFLNRSGRFVEAIEYGRQGTQLSPQSEKASLVLFHSLWNAGQRIEALDEMKRFLSANPSEEYSRMIKEWELSEGDEPALD